MNRTSSLIALLTAAILTAIAAYRLSHPAAPAPESAEGFSAHRASKLLHSVIGSKPHPLGTVEHDAVRDRILAHLRVIGYSPEIQKQFVCSPYGACATVENIIATLPGERPESVLVACHYDSVPAGPGAGDDGSGTVATLEIARLLRASRPRNTVIFLLDDGEEAGLLGAEAFVRFHPAARSIGAVVNVEARGTSGPSVMFETSPDHGWLIRLLQQNVRRPVMTSLFYEIYKRLPNDTDLTVFKREKREGVNFGVIGNPLRYHTPLDHPDLFSIETLQHQGDSALEITRALSMHDLSKRGGGEMTYFDILQSQVVAWPSGWNLALVVVGAIGSFVAISMLIRRRKLTPGGVGRAVLMQLLAGVATAAVAWVASKILGHETSSFIARPLLASAFVSLLAVGLLVLLLRGVTARETIAAAAVVFLLIGLAACFGMPGASYLAIVPLFGCAIALWLMTSDAAIASSIAALIAVAASAIVSLPLILVLVAAMGASALTGIAIVATIFGVTTAAYVAPADFSRGIGVVLGAAAIGCAITLLALPTFTRDDARPLSVSYVQETDEAKTVWRVDGGIALPPAFTRSLSWTPSKAISGALKYGSGSVETPAPDIRLQPPTVELLRSRPTPEGREIVLRVRSNRGAPRILLELDEMRTRFRSGAINGVELPPFADRYWRRMPEGKMRLSLRNAAAQGDEVVLRLSGVAAVRGVVQDATYGVPSDVVTKLRSERETPIQDGDITVVRKKFQLQ